MTARQLGPRAGRGPVLTGATFGLAGLMIFSLTTHSSARAAATNPPLPPPLDRATLPTAAPVDGVPEVGALFPGGVGALHTCTAVGLATGGQNLALTAAHCITGTGTGTEFAPGYRNGQTPQGVWAVQATYADQRWITDQDPRFDVAVLVLAPKADTGAPAALPGYRLAAAPAADQPITVTGYTFGGDQPISCRTAAYAYEGYPAFNCNGFTPGTSGSPFVGTVGGDATPTLHGVLGGPWQGGCFDYTSYSAPFGAEISALVERAAKGGAGDTLPIPGPPTC